MGKKLSKARGNEKPEVSASKTQETNRPRVPQPRRVTNQTYGTRSCCNHPIPQLSGGNSHNPFSPYAWGQQNRENVAETQPAREQESTTESVSCTSDTDSYDGDEFRQEVRTILASECGEEDVK